MSAPDAFADLPVVDRTAVERLQRIGGGSLLNEMIALFLEHGVPRVDAAEQGMADADLDRVERAVHSLKSSAGNLGGRRLQMLAQTIEDHAEAGDAEAAGALVPSLRHELDALTAELAAMRDAAGTT